jgi:hypothetical protein
MEQLLFLVFLVMAALANILVRWARRRAAAPPRDSRPERPRPTERRGRAGTTAVHVPAPRPELAVFAPQRPPGRVSRRRPPHRRLGRHADVRRAIVVMTILAPCRALESDPGDRR